VYYNNYVVANKCTHKPDGDIMGKLWTREEIVELLNYNDRAVERAMVSIWEHQTAAEQERGATILNNGVGFCGWSAKNGSYYARWVKSGRHLTGKHLDKARRIALHHAGQLTRIANNNTM
jgi:hypothetical protein